MTPVQDLDTPALVVDLDIMERNLRRVQDYCTAHGLNLRPHTKTHKSIGIGRRQLDLGAVGLTVAKPGEAEAMLGAEPRDLLVAYPVIGEAKMRRLASIAAVTKVTVAIDSLVGAQQLSSAAQGAGVRIGFLTEIDVGLGRVGVTPEEAVLLTAEALKLPNLDWRGINFYPGHIKSQDKTKLAELAALVKRICDGFSAAGLNPEIVSGGSTPSLFHSHEIPGLTEIRPGTYVFNDLNTIASGACVLEDCAASVLVTVVSRAREGHMIVDGGSKTFSSDKLSSGGPGHGRLNEAPGAYFHKMNEEHGFVDLTNAERTFAVGDKVSIIPNHICVVVNLHEYVYGARNGVVEEVWRVDARGKLQ
ncbi:MAG TPA: alanine racemase [Bryobacteraceae bacterium]|nr:alanine racemase [Bryobacteraceae bacterium]